MTTRAMSQEVGGHAYIDDTPPAPPPVLEARCKVKSTASLCVFLSSPVQRVKDVRKGYEKRVCLRVIVALKRTRYVEVWFETSLARRRFCTCVLMEWSQPAATSHFF